MRHRWPAYAGAWSDAVAAKILRERGALRGERKNVAVLFCDLRGFTALSERLGPEPFVAALYAYLDVMVRCISALGWVVDKFIGDAIMGVFGGVEELANQNAAVLLAAREMRAALAAFDGTGCAVSRHEGPDGAGPDVRSCAGARATRVPMALGFVR